MNDQRLMERLRAIREATDAVEQEATQGRVGPDDLRRVYDLMDTDFTSDERVKDVVSMVAHLIQDSAATSADQLAEVVRDCGPLKTELDRLLAAGSTV